MIEKKILTLILLTSIALSFGPSSVDAVSTKKIIPRAERTNSPEKEMPHIENSLELSIEVDALLSTNLIQNPGFESGSTTPDFWKRGRWGTNSPTFYYPVNGFGGGRAVRVTMAGKVTGDAKWYFDPITVTPGSYTYSDDYVSSVPTYITLQLYHSNGAITYQDLAQAPATPAFTWRHFTQDFTIPEGVVAVSVFHLINRNGALTTDNISLVQNTDDPNPGIFETGAVTIRLDDNWISQYENAFPILDGAGLKSTLYVTSRQISDNNFPGYMSRAQIEEVYTNGHEIGAHTRTHRDLATLSNTEQISEIRGSRDDILAWGVGPVLSFSYPFGSYTSETVQIVRDSGFQSAASSNGGLVTMNSDPYQLERRAAENTTTFAQIQQWIDQAMTENKWLILTVHEVKSSCPDRYCITTPLFAQIINYLDTENIPVVTVSEALASISN